MSPKRWWIYVIRPKHPLQTSVYGVGVCQSISKVEDSEKFFFGTAVYIGDGFFLTAAHVLKRERTDSDQALYDTFVSYLVICICLLSRGILT